MTNQNENFLKNIDPIKVIENIKKFRALNIHDLSEKEIAMI